MDKYTLLIEIGTDELPYRLLKKIGQDLFYYIKCEFDKNKIFYDSIAWFASPCHLAIKSKIAIMNNNNIVKFNKDNKKNVSYGARNIIKDNETVLNIDINNEELNLDEFENQIKYEENFLNNTYVQSLLLKMIFSVFSQLTHHISMRWGNVDKPFIRPVNTITILLDSYLIKGRIFEKNINRIIYGHRYIENNKIILNHADDYPEILARTGYVIVDYNRRKEMIRATVEEQALKLGGFVIQDDFFLEEITSLVEWPVILYGKFNRRFLKLPNELIIHIMKYNQKYFPIYDKISGELLPYFIFVVNTITDNYKKIVDGHENVIKTRFIDVEFFLKRDSQYCLEDYIPKLNTIIFHRKLGNLRDKVNRITKLSGWIAYQIHEDVSQAKRAGYLCKCDLMTDIVLEFPAMQGIIGMYYARRDGEPERIALAQKEHYQPKYTSDILPTDRISCIVSIADKIDTISGIFSIEEFPTGSRDPFGLKRFASAILKIIIKKGISLDLSLLIHQSVILYTPILTNVEYVKNNVYKFMYKRLCSYYCTLGYKLNIIQSVLKTKYWSILDLDMYINSVNNFYLMHKSEGIELKLLYKRISNILKTTYISSNDKMLVSKSAFSTTEEMQFFLYINSVKKKLNMLLKNRKYDDALNVIVHLSDPVSIFLDHFLILHEDKYIRNNRLILLDLVRKIILKVVDISVLYR